MPTPNHPALPLCSQFAAHPDRYIFAGNMQTILYDQPADLRQAEVRHLTGMLAAYLEADVINCEQHSALRHELYEFAYGAKA
ncbi:hypothetical protein [Pseudomonas sp. Marseille-Q8238]